MRFPSKLALLFFGLASTATAQEAELPKVDFQKHIAPILVSHCLECHRGESPKGGLDLTHADGAMKGGDSGAAIAVGDASGSLLWERVQADEMPPKHPLSPQQKAFLKRWIDQGAAWGPGPLDLFSLTTPTRAGRDWWSLQPLRETPAPRPGDPEWCRNAIDAFVQRKLEAAGLRPAPEADPRTLIRRLYFDLIGLPPTPEQVAEFVADPSEEAYRRVVNELLASQHYGERWGRHWLDVVRFGESDGFERNFQRENAWPYRDWVIRALNEDMPYDQFARMQLIGDQLVGGTEGAAATGFWVAGVHNTVVGGSKRMKQLARQDELEEVLATVGQTFVGLTFNCARCHDHKFDPITQAEYYQLSSAISGLGYGERTEVSSAEQQVLAGLDQQLKTLQDALAAIDQRARREIIAARESGEAPIPDPPMAFARWEFDGDLKDSRGGLHGKAVGNARVEAGALVLDGQSFVETGPLPKAIGEKTLEAWVQLDDLEQRGGAAVSLETTNGAVFDAIVFGEREPGRWMPGSNVFARTESFQGPAESEAADRPVHLAIVYHQDGTIVAYRDGLAYGRPVRKAPLQAYQGGDSEILFGLRHKPPGGNRHLKARIHRAAFYDRALSAEEVAASAGNSLRYVPEAQLVEWMDEPQRRRRAELKSQIERLVAERAEQAAKAKQKIYTLTPGGGTTTHVLLRGDPDHAGDVVSPAAPEVVPGLSGDFGLPPDAPENLRRRKLAQWITHEANPLFARVMVNRVWHYRFGAGIVDTPNDLGFNGGRPTHPELLEFLAWHFQHTGYRLKDLHRLIVKSSTYRQATHGLPEVQLHQGRTVDASNRLLWRGSPRRLEAESLRDAMLAVAGKLDGTLGGPSFKDVSIVLNNGTTYYEPIDATSPELWRRTVYRFNPRGGRSALLDTFDCPDPAATAPRRSVTTTPLQSLSLLNNEFALRMADAFAARVQSEVGDSVEAQVVRAWQLAVAREPTASELDLSTQLVTQHGLPALCRGLFNFNEFVRID